MALPLIAAQALQGGLNTGGAAGILPSSAPITSGNELGSINIGAPNFRDDQQMFTGILLPVAVAVLAAAVLLKR